MNTINAGRFLHFSKGERGAPSSHSLSLALLSSFQSVAMLSPKRLLSPDVNIAPLVPFNLFGISTDVHRLTGIACNMDETGKKHHSISALTRA